ncbi:MAG: hypothetical protein ACTSPM_03040 [Candidatus Heimdallarchaeota archaeon]
MQNKDDLGKTVDQEDNLARMILIEQAVDAAYEIEDKVSRSYAFCDCIIGIIEYAREINKEDTMEKIPTLFTEITNKGAYVRAQSFYAIALASFGHEDESENILLEAIRNSIGIKDDFDRRDAMLDIATAAGDMSFILDKNELITTALTLIENLTKAQKAYLYGYLSVILTDEESTSLMRKAVDVANSIRDPIARSKVYLELSSLSTTIDKLEE